MYIIILNQYHYLYFNMCITLFLEKVELFCLFTINAVGKLVKFILWVHFICNIYCVVQCSIFAFKWLLSRGKLKYLVKYKTLKLHLCPALL